MTDNDQSLVLATLPDEILQAIAQYLDATSLVRLGWTARRFASLANEPLLWKTYCQHEFRYWNDRQAFRNQLRDVSYHDWKQKYRDRQTVSWKTRKALDKVVYDCRGRSDRIQTIIEHGYEAKEALLRAYRESPSSPTHLAQKYWSHIALGCLHRTMALEQWTAIRGRDDVENPTVKALSALDLFILDQEDKGDPDDIRDRLGYYVDEVRAAYPDLAEQSPRTIAMTIASYLRQRRWVGIDEGRPYHSLDNKFLGVALFSSHNNSLPLISAVIYCHVAQQFGLDAQPINYPMHVFVVVRPPAGTDIDGHPLSTSADPSSKTHLYMDPSRTIEPITTDWFRANTHFINPSATPAEAASYMTPSSYRDLLIRSAHNLLNSQETELHHPPGSQPHHIPADSATYAAFFAIALFPTHQITHRTHLTRLTKHLLHHFEHDLHIFRTYILPLTATLADPTDFRALATQLSANDAEAPLPKFRSQTPTATVSYRVGQLFRHRRRGYLALIYGWDPTCRMTQQWIMMNQVDGLPRGRAQPFYHVLVIDDRSTRYVAEENVVLLGPVEDGGNGEMVTTREVEGWPVEVGRWMRRFVVRRREGGEGVGWAFESNVKAEYPED